MFTQVEKKTFVGGGRDMWQNMLIPIHFEQYSLILIIFMAIFGLEKMLVCTLFEVSEKVYALYTYENIDIF